MNLTLTNYTMNKTINIFSNSKNDNTQLYTSTISFELLFNLKEGIISSRELTKDELQLKKHISRKCSGYKQQDKKHLKREIIINKIAITKMNLIDMLISTNGYCYYCKKKYNLMPICRNDRTQWSLDRIDNTQIHSLDNCVISCLDCNLIRRRRDCDKWRDTKQMIIKKED